MNRREFISLLGGTAAWPLAARGQQAAMPVVGYLSLGTPEVSSRNVAAFQKGLTEAGFVDGRNVVIEFRWAQNNRDRLSELAVGLARGRVAAIVTEGTGATLAVKAATTTIPIVFSTGADPVRVGLVASLSRPGSNVTGVTTTNPELASKRLGLLHELVPKAARIGVLVDPNVPLIDSDVGSLQTGASAIGLQIEVVHATTSAEIDTAFATLVQQRADALLVTPNPLFASRRVQLATLAVRDKVPVISFDRGFVEAGGLMSYASSQAAENYRQAGIYTGRILKGEKPADLPVMRATKFEFVINLQTAKTLGITVPPTLLSLADTVIE
jgi:putative ABC transport system substrate-binding protein